MYSKSKYRITPDLLSALAKRAFGAGTRIDRFEELHGGYFNAAYRLVLNQGAVDTVLKISPPDDIKTLSYERGLMRTEVQVLKLLAQVQGIQVARLFHADFERDLIPCDWFFAATIPGQTWNLVRDTLPPEQNHSIERSLGRVQALINAQVGEGFGLFPASGRRRFSTWRDAFLDMMEMLLADADKYQAQLPMPLGRIRDLVVSKAVVLEEVPKPRLVYWDLWAGNIMVAEKDGQWDLTGIIDSDRALWGDPLMESIFGWENIPESFYQGYGQVPWTHGEQVRRLLYNVYLFTIMVVEDIPREYEDHSLTQWSYGRLKASLELLEKSALERAE